MTYPDTDPRAHLDEAVEDSGAAYVRPSVRLSTGSERDDDETGPVNPALYLPRKESSAPVVESGRRGRATPGSFVHSTGISNSHSRVHDARRRPSSHKIAAPKKVVSAWDRVITACDEADRLVREIPLSMAAANEARSRVLAEATEPVVLPSAADARAFAEQQASAACRAAIKARADYDALVVALAPEWAASLGDEVPKMSADILARVEGLEADLVALREATQAYVDQAGAAQQGRLPARMPSTARLDGLAQITQEAAALAATAANPTQPDIQPPAHEREEIMLRNRNALGPTPEVITLCRIEEQEDYRFTSLTRGLYPPHVLRAAEGQWI